MASEHAAVSQLFPKGRPKPQGTMAAQIVAEVRDALFAKRLRPGDFLGTEKDLAARARVSRMAARDALRTLEALGVIDIKVGLGGGARIAQGDPTRFAGALAIQLELIGVAPAEILDAQRAIECLAAELAAEHATAADHDQLEELLEVASRALDQPDAFTRASLEFHLAVAASSHNRVLLVQLISLQHVAWPARNRTLTRAVAEKVLQAHRDLLDLIERRDGPAARALMDEHIKMIRARRVAERVADDAHACC